MDLSYIVSQPWVIPSAAGIGAFVLGLIIASMKKNSSNWFSSVVFFLPNLLLDLLDMVHTKKFKYYGLILALLCIEAFFAARASVVYYDVLGPHMSSIEIALVCALVFISVGLCGYMVATHGKPNVWSVITAIFVILHDWSGTVYMNYSPVANNTTSAAQNGTLTVLITIGMCGLSILPFIMGRWVEQLYPELEAEMQQEVDSYTKLATRKIKRRAIDKVLRMANHTNVVHLVRALPADEFADFKSFVMPIIAPGVAHNLDEIEGQTNSTSGTMTSTNQQNGIQVTGQPGNPETGKLAAANQQTGNQPTGKLAAANRQNGSQPTGKLAGSQPAERQPANRHNDSQNGSQAPGQTGSQKPASKTVLRDEKIRQYAASHPDLTHAKLAAKYKVSERTIARALSPDQGQSAPPAKPQQDATELLENPESKPTPNGHNKTQERDTDEMKTLVLAGEDLVDPARQN